MIPIAKFNFIPFRSLRWNGIRGLIEIACARVLRPCIVTTTDLWPDSVIGATNRSTTQE